MQLEILIIHLVIMFDHGGRHFIHSFAPGLRPMLRELRRAVNRIYAQLYRW